MPYERASKIPINTYVRWQGHFGIVIADKNPWAKSYSNVLIGFVSDASTAGAWKKDSFKNHATKSCYFTLVDDAQCGWGYWTDGETELEIVTSVPLESVRKGTKIKYRRSIANLVDHATGNYGDILLGWQDKESAPTWAWQVKNEVELINAKCAYGYWAGPSEHCDIIIGDISQVPQKAHNLLNKHHGNTVDVSDWRVWAKQPKGNCPCGISRNDCDYHRGG